jgi:hypothetical protein
MSETKAKRVVRRIVEPPTPQDLKDARETRLREALLENSRMIYDRLVAWDRVSTLVIEVNVVSAFEGNLLAAYYTGKGYDASFDGATLSFEPIEEAPEAAGTE